MTLLLAMLLWLVLGGIAILLFGGADQFENMALVVVILLLFILMVLGWPFLLYGIRRNSNHNS